MNDELLALDETGLDAAVRECARITAPEITNDEYEQIKADNSPRYQNTRTEMGRAIRAYLRAAKPALSSIVTCCVTGAIPGDGGACGDCDPCLLGEASLPSPVKRLIAEKNSLLHRIGELEDKLAETLTAPGETTKSDGGEPLSRTAGGFPVAAAPSQAEETGVIQSTRQGAGIERGMDQSVTGGESAATKPGRSDPSSTRSDVTGDARTKIEWWLNEISECNERMWNGSRASYFGQIAKGVAQIRALLDQFEIRRK